MGVPFSWNQRSPSEPLSSITLMMLLLVQRLPGCSIFLRARLLVASYFTFATTAVTHPSESDRADASSSVWCDACVSSLLLLACAIVQFAASFFELVKVRYWNYLILILSFLTFVVLDQF